MNSLEVKITLSIPPVFITSDDISDVISSLPYFKKHAKNINNMRMFNITLREHMVKNYHNSIKLDDVSIVAFKRGYKNQYMCRKSQLTLSTTSKFDIKYKESIDEAIDLDKEYQTYVDTVKGTHDSEDVSKLKSKYSELSSYYKESPDSIKKLIDKSVHELLTGYSKEIETHMVKPYDGISMDDFKVKFINHRKIYMEYLKTQYLALLNLFKYEKYKINEIKKSRRSIGPCKYVLYAPNTIAEKFDMAISYLERVKRYDVKIESYSYLSPSNHHYRRVMINDEKGVKIATVDKHDKRGMVKIIKLAYHLRG